jgi:hypothetical protein
VCRDNHEGEHHLGDDVEDRVGHNLPAHRPTRSPSSPRICHSLCTRESHHHTESISSPLKLPITPSLPLKKTPLLRFWMQGLGRV